eukprot:scaffold107842_cov69-Phaeocystis_antarctica.AAC.8
MRPSSCEGTGRDTAARRRTAARSAGRPQAAAASTASTAARPALARWWQRRSTCSRRTPRHDSARSVQTEKNDAWAYPLCRSSVAVLKPD